jgi:uncharacterized repeat protein (TIGR03803 family)
MRNIGHTFTSILAAAILAVGTLGVPAAVAAEGKLIHNFNGDNGVDGGAPWAGLIADAAGNLYGTTQMGGAYSYGAVFEVLPKPGGGWTERILHSFNNNDVDGYYPVAGLVFDAAGNLYGTTTSGGTHDNGTAFELVPKPGAWGERILHNFNDNDADGADGYLPYSSLVIDNSGNLYGTTVYGGANDNGSVYELSPKGSSWTETILHSFVKNSVDGAYPYAGLVFDSSGNLYGTTTGINYNLGAVFELLPQTGGTWEEQILYSFTSANGYAPYAGLVIDGSGNLYGTTTEGGTYGGGVVFELSPQAGGGWSQSVLHNFNATGKDGFEPYSGVIFDASGNLYGTTNYGGDGTNCMQGCGTVFELTPQTGGGWGEVILHRFNNSLTDGARPYGGVVFGASGNLYSTTTYGGSYGWGTVFEVTP